MFSAMMFALKQIGDHSLQAKKIWHKKRICYLQKKCFLHLMYVWLYFKIFLFTQKKISSSKSGIIQRTDFWTKHFLDLLKVWTQTFDF